MQKSVSSTSMKEHTVASFFAGVGGIELGFEQTSEFRVVYANEVDKNAHITYQMNFPDVFLDVRDIHDVEAVEVPYVDVITGGFPCQAFSIAGYRKGFEDERGDLFFEMLRVIKEKQPKVIFIENVKNMVTHDHGNTFKVIRESLVANDYYIKWKVLNGKDYGNIPQNRERIYIVGFRDKPAYDAFEFPEPVEMTSTLKDIINYQSIEDEKYYYREGKQPFYDKIEESVKSYDSVYQWRRQYVRENKSGVVPTLTANMGTGGHNVPIIYTENGIRKLTPRETFNAQGYPRDYELPDLAMSHLYKQAGNSVVVPVIRRIADNISEVLNQTQIEDDQLITQDYKYALMYTKNEGNNSGESYIHSYANSLEDIKSILESNEEQIPLLNDVDYKELVKKRKSMIFYSIITL
ncbi:DNA cytosine methyltransferase [Fundicoccus sp. Sow4_F4]|uniref:DNA cytosine methyltransferase n=1 Tax=Fundicoccus sp. Sow4_F4 TaxID=3438783 RepID=UPI003F9156D9